DEHDTDEEDDIREIENDHFAIRALTPIEDFNERFGTEFSDDEFDTVGGLVMQQFGHLPRRGEHTILGGWRFVILNADTRRIRLLEAYRDHRRDEDEDDDQEDKQA
ncbi:MAG: transporter associated domain-containing protein, partial [Halomonas sp.]